MNQTISIIVAIGRNNEIGFENHLLWSLPNDMKHFKNITSGHTVIMGRNTFLSLPDGALPNRKNIVISNVPEDNFAGCLMVSSIDEAVEVSRNDGEVFIMGGASIYRQFLPIADRLYITMVDDVPNADVYFPDIDNNIWHITSKEDFNADDKHKVNYSFVVFER